MDQLENCFLSQNKLLEELLDHCLHSVEARLDRLYKETIFSNENNRDTNGSNQPNQHSHSPNQLSSNTFLTFKAPYIRDFRNFSGPSNEDVKQLRDLTGTENIDLLIKTKNWSHESSNRVFDAVLDYYAQNHLVELLKQKNHIVMQIKNAAPQACDDLKQKLNLIEEQVNQVKARKEPRIFVPEERNDPLIDWCAISAKLSSTHHDSQDCRLLWSNKLHWNINEGLWTKDEDLCLLNAVQKLGKNDWNSVAKELNSNRLPWQCCSRYNQHFANMDSNSSAICREDLDKMIEIINLCRIGNFVPWNQVMYFIQYYSLLQVKYQWQKFINEKRSSQPWTSSEDVLLLKSVEKFGERDWLRISNYVPGRSNKSCRERYIMRLKFNKRAVGNWTRKEDDILLSLTNRFGSNWSLISSLFPERNCHQLRSRFELLKKDVVRSGPVRRKKIHKNQDGLLVCHSGRHPKLSSEHEVDEKLKEIFSFYRNIKTTNKSLICRSAQDELIYQTLIQVLKNAIIGREYNHDLMTEVIKESIKQKVTSKYDLFPPSLSTIQAYRAWNINMKHSSKLQEMNIDKSKLVYNSEYRQLVKIITSLFLWPAVLSRTRKPDIDIAKFQFKGIIERDSKIFYQVRDLQNRLSSKRND